MYWMVLRHNLGSLLVQNCVPLQKVQKVLGDKDLRRTLRYAHRSNADGIEAASVFGKVRPSTLETDTKTNTKDREDIHIIENRNVA